MIERSRCTNLNRMNPGAPALPSVPLPCLESFVTHRHAAPRTTLILGCSSEQMGFDQLFLKVSLFIIKVSRLSGIRIPTLGSTRNRPPLTLSQNHHLPPRRPESPESHPMDTTTNKEEREEESVIKWSFKKTGLDFKTVSFPQTPKRNIFTRDVLFMK